MVEESGTTDWLTTTLFAPPPICADCAHQTFAKNEPAYLCGARIERDRVTGWPIELVACTDRRARRADCGPAGRLFVPRIPLPGQTRYTPAEWRNTQPVDRQLGTIGIGFTTAAGPVRLSLPTASARHLAETLRDYLAATNSHSPSSAGSPSSDVSEQRE